MCVQIQSITKLLEKDGQDGRPRFPSVESKGLENGRMEEEEEEMNRTRLVRIIEPTKALNSIGVGQRRAEEEECQKKKERKSWDRYRRKD